MFLFISPYFEVFGNDGDPQTFKLYPSDSGKHKNWRDMALVTFVKGTVLYAVGTTHTIDGQKERSLPSGKKC